MHNFTLNRLGVPNFNGFHKTDADVIIDISIFGKFKKKLVSMINITIDGGYRFVK